MNNFTIVDVEVEEKSDDSIDQQQNANYSLLHTALTLLYGLLSVSLICHCTVIYMLIRIVIRCKCRDTIYNCIYVLALTVVDALVISHLPLLVAEMVQQEWTFGLALCRFFWLAECVNKILSTFLLTALCFDRYIAVCYPASRTTAVVRRPRSACLIIGVCTCVILVLLSPMYSNAELYDFPVAANRTAIKCVVNWSQHVERYFTIMLFLIGYCIPLVLMAYFYCSIVLRLRQRNAVYRLANHKRQLKSVTKRSFALVLFYFVCWTPFWIISFGANSFTDGGNGFVIAFYFIHALVYLNAAMNPIFYAVFNKHLMRHLVSSKRSQMKIPKASTSNFRLSNMLIYDIVATTV